MRFFSDRLLAEIARKNSPVVVGLDPSYQRLPESIRRGFPATLEGAANAILEFNRLIIAGVAEVVPAVKPQIAFYERYGAHGVRAFKKTVDFAHEHGLIVIEDAKRNDIGTTAAAYSDGHIGRAEINEKLIPVFDVDAITVTPFLGEDGVAPFLEDLIPYGKGLFILVKTSNPSSGDLQDLDVAVRGGHTKLCELLAVMVDEWGKACLGTSGYSSVGAVVGATFPEQAKKLRRLMPNAIFLVPGFGAQGAEANDVVDCFNEDCTGAVISASRSVIYAFETFESPSENAISAAARTAVKAMRDSINTALNRRR